MKSVNTLNNNYTNVLPIFELPIDTLMEKCMYKAKQTAVLDGI